MRSIQSLLIMALCTLLFPCSSLAQSGIVRNDAVKTRQYTKEHPLIYEDYWDLWPYSYIDDYGQPAGYHIDLIKKLLTNLNIPFEIRLKSSNKVLEDMLSKEAGLMISVYRNDRDSIAIWGNQNIALFSQGILRASDEPEEISRIEDIKNHNVVMRESSLVYKHIKEIGLEQHVTAVPDVKPYIFEIAEKNKGIVIWNYISLKFLKEKYNLKNLVLTPLNTVSAPSRFMSNDSLLVSQLDDAFMNLDQSELNVIRNKWIYPELQETGIPEYVLTILWFVLGLVLVIFIGYVIIHRLLRMSFLQGDEVSNVMYTVTKLTGVQMHIYDTKKQVVHIFANEGEVERTIHAVDYLAKFTRKSVNLIHKARLEVLSGVSVSSSFVVEKITTEKAKHQFFCMTMTKCHLKERHKNHIFITVREVSDEEQNRISLVNAYRKYNAAMEPPLVDHAVTNKNGTLVRGNANLFRTFGITSPEAFKALQLTTNDIPPLRFYGFNNRPTRSVNIFNMDNMDIIEPFKDVVTRRGLMYWDVQSYPSYDEKGEVTGMAISGRDVTDLVLNYRKLKQYIEDNSQINNHLRCYVDKLNIAFRSTHIAQVEYFPDTQTFTVKRNVWKNKTEIKQLDVFSIIEPQDREQALIMMRNLDMRVDENVRLQAHINIKKIIKRRWIDVLFTPVHDSKGRVTHYTGTIQDRTNEEKSFTKLIKEKKSAVEADSLKRAFISNMHQQISTPLNEVISYANKLSQTHDKEETQLAIDQIKDNTDQLINLINDILALSRIDADMEVFNVEEVDVINLIESNHRLLVMQYRQNDVTCNLTGDYEKLILEVDSTHLITVFKYLFSNSLRTTSNGWVNCRYMYRNGELLITIEDTGVGISADKLNHAFDKDFKNIESDKYDSGLTYTICQELVNSMGGHIEISAYPQRGTYIWIGIPCKPIQVLSK